MCDEDRVGELEREVMALRALVEIARDAIRTVEAGAAHFTGYDSTCER